MLKGLLEMYVTYALINDSGDEFYIGAGLESRPYDHLKGFGNRPLVNEIIREHRERGSDVSVRIIKKFDEKERAFEHEIELIEKIGRKSDGGKLVNICLGGPGVNGYKATEEQRAINSAVATKRFSNPEERKKTSDSTRMAMVDPLLRRHISDKLTDKWKDQEYRGKQVLSHTGIKDSEETKAVKAEAQRKAWSSGKRLGKYTDDQVRDIYNAKGKEKVDNVALRHGMNPTYVHKIWRHERCVMSLKRLGILKS